MYKPKKQLGQNFLSDKKVLLKIIDVANISKDDIVLEIGPGQGSMTYHLAQKAKKVVAVEKDAKLYQYLLNKFVDSKNIQLIHSDILDLLGNPNYPEFFPNIPNRKYKIVANIPYYLTSFLLRRIFEIKNKPSEIILMVQKEVAERICASPRQGRGKEGKMNLLAISVQVFADPEILFYVSKNSFWPKPKVDSGVIKLKVYPVKSIRQFDGVNKVCKVGDPEKFLELVKTGFTAKRKLLANNLAKGLDIPKEEIYDIFREARIDIKARAQDLSIEDWLAIYSELNESM